VLVTGDGSMVGALPPFEVDTPWWQDAEAVVRGARERLGVDVTILRMLAAERTGPPGGAVTYLAEVAAPVPAQPWPGVIDDHALRLPWADPDGPERDLRWTIGGRWTASWQTWASGSPRPRAAGCPDGVRPAQPGGLRSIAGRPPPGDGESRGLRAHLLERPAPARRRQELRSRGCGPDISLTRRRARRNRSSPSVTVAIHRRCQQQRCRSANASRVLRAVVPSST
jgi:hypothetical protein